mgnify:CR=1 FL=1
MSRTIITGIDIRPDRVVCVIAHELEIVNQGTFLQLIGHGIVELPIDCVDPFQYPEEELEKYIRQSIDKAEIESNVSVKEAYISIYDHNDSIYIDQEIEIGNEVVTNKMINSFFKQREFKSLYSDAKEPLHSFPISHRINNLKSVSDPIGMRVNNLRTRWHIIMSDSDRLNKLRSIFENLQVSVRQFIASAYTSSISTLSEEESSHGSAVIDIGKKRGEIKNQTYLTTQRVELIFDMPLAEIVFDFYDRLKTVSKGYASFDYTPIGLQVSKLVRVDILLNANIVDALSALIHADNAYRIGKKICEFFRQ